MIVVTTPTGSIGHQVLDLVLAGDDSIRVIARDPARLAARARERIEIVQGSMDDPEVVSKAFAGADCVLLVIPPNPGAESIQRHLLDFIRPVCEAITSQGVKRVVGVSSLGRGIARNAGQISAIFAMDDLIESTGVSYRSLCMPGFMENMLWQVESIKSRSTFFLPGSGDRRVPTCATRDVAAVAAALLLDDSWSGQESVPVLGPEDLSYNDMAHIMSEVLQRPVRFQQVPADAYKATMMRHGMSDAWAQGIIDMSAAVEAGIYDGARTPQSATPHLGAPHLGTPTSFRQWCEEILRPAVLA